MSTRLEKVVYYAEVISESELKTLSNFYGNFKKIQNGFENGFEEFLLLY